MTYFKRFDQSHIGGKSPQQCQTVPLPVFPRSPPTTTCFLEFDAMNTTASPSSASANLDSFSVELKRRIGDSEGVRPLLCSGNPLTCTVALVGANPGTTTPFWPFWRNDVGVDKDSWLQAYRQAHGGKYGRSRAAIERFLPLVAAEVIELNAHAKQSARLAELAAHHRTSDVLEFVLRAVRPKVVLCAGADALKAVEQIPADWSMAIISAPHFIYWGRDRERQLADAVNASLRAPQPHTN